MVNSASSLFQYFATECQQLLISYSLYNFSIVTQEVLLLLYGCNWVNGHSKDQRISSYSDAVRASSAFIKGKPPQQKKLLLYRHENLAPSPSEIPFALEIEREGFRSAGVRCPTKRGGRNLINDRKPLFHHELGGARCPTIPEGEGEADSSWLIRISTGAYFFPFMFRWTGGVHVKTKRNYTLEPNRLLLQSIFFSLTKYFHQEHRIKSSNFSTYSIVDLI